MSKIKKIGIVGHFTGSNSFGITKPYLYFWSNFGEVSIISPLEKHVRDLDLLVLPGGPDVDVFRYLEADDDIHLAVGQPCMQRERFDKMLLPKYIEANTPIYGTCRGMQSLAVHFKGKLNQHMSHETNGEDRSKLVHGIKFENTNVVPGLNEFVKSIGNKKYEINSIHHQTVSDDKLPEEITVLARHDKDNHIEAMTLFPYYPIHANQHHVEEIYDPFAITLISHLLSLSDEEETK